MKGKLALVRETGTERNLCQLELIVFPQEVLCSLNAARDQILVWRQPGARLELPGEVIGAEMSDGSHLLQRGTAFEIFHDVFHACAYLRDRRYPARRDRQPMRTGGMTDQVNGQDSGERLDQQLLTV